MAKPLVIVESPTKKKTIERFLGSDYMVEASVGHIRDLPANAKDIPESARKAGVHPDFAVNIEEGFKPYYIVPADKKKHVAELRALMKHASIVYLATDEDREERASPGTSASSCSPPARSSAWCSTRSPRGDPRRAGEHPVHR